MRQTLNPHWWRKYREPAEGLNVLAVERSQSRNANLEITYWSDGSLTIAQRSASDPEPTDFIALNRTHIKLLRRLLASLLIRGVLK